MASHLIGQNSLSPDELKDNLIGKIACAYMCACNSANSGCLSTCFDLRNAVLGYERPKLNKFILIFEIKIMIYINH